MAVLATARRRRFERGRMFLGEGEPAGALHLVQRGRFAAGVHDEAGSAMTVRVLGVGDAFGELSLVHFGAPRSRSVSVTALEPSETLSISGRRFAELRTRHPSVDRLMIHLLAAWVEDLSERLLETLFVGVDERVHRRLFDLTTVYFDGHHPVCVPLTQEDLAGMAGATRPTVNRVLRNLANDGIVELHRGRIAILDRARLRDLAV